jgi:hypothetical protein
MLAVVVVTSTCCFATHPCRCLRISSDARASPFRDASARCEACSSSLSARPLASAISTWGSLSRSLRYSVGVMPDATASESPLRPAYAAWYMRSNRASVARSGLGPPQGKD